MRLRYHGIGAALIMLGLTGSSWSLAHPVVTSPVAAPVVPPPAPAPANAPEPYVLGTLRYAMASDIPADKIAAIRDAMDFAVMHSNTLGAFSGTVSVVFGATTPTADASYHGQIRFGGQIGRRVALHELGHWLGAGTVAEWSRLLAARRFKGTAASLRLAAFDGPDATLSADGMHFWPYGMNFDNEFSEPQRHTQLVSAEIADMRLADDATAAVTGTRRFQNRSNMAVLRSSSSGNIATRAFDRADATQDWQVGFLRGFVTLATPKADLALTTTGKDGATAMARLSDDASGQWEMIPTTDGWFQLRNRTSRRCLAVTAKDSTATDSCDDTTRQQWRFVR